MGSFFRIMYRLSSLYWTGRAIRRGRLPQREARKYAYRTTGRIIRRLLR